jgi:hypothetical protein
MDAHDYPLSRLTLRAASRAEDLGFVALADVARAMHDLDEVLVIGGQMISLHAYRWGLGAELFRESKDADVGIPETLARDEGIVERLEALDYRQHRGGEFVRVLRDEADEDGGFPEAAIDVLIPARTSRARASRRVSARLVTTEVPGLATALLRPAVPVELALTRLNGTPLDARISLPDEVSTVILRAHAWQKRLTDTDAQDIWRSLEIAFAAAVTPADFRSDDAKTRWTSSRQRSGGTLAERAPRWADA